MPRYAADIETDGLLPELTKIHCMVLVDLDTGHAYDFRPDNVEVALDFAKDADLLVFHNGIMFDVPAIQKVYPGWEAKGVLRDTLILSRLVYPDIKRADLKLRAKNPDALPMDMVGRHSLKSWGYRLKDHKGDFDGPWDQWSPSMHEYMIQDGRLGARLFRFLMSKQPPEEAIEMEHQFQEYLRVQQEQGVPFNSFEAVQLYAHLAEKRRELEQELRGLYRPWFANKGVVKPPKARRYWTHEALWGGDQRRVKFDHGYGYEKGYWNHVVGPYSQIKLTEFNPSSRDHISDRLMTLHGWQPQEFGKNGKPTVDDVIISQLPYPEAPQIGTYLMVSKRIGQLAEGNEAWLKVVGKDGRIHGEVLGIGTATFRCSHRKPNITQVPKVIKGKTGLEGGYGAECRSLFYAPQGFLLVGADASGIELRMLGHYNHRYDSGEFIHNLLEGDVHAVNMAALAELAPNRDAAKTLMYALLYGAGDRKLGTTVLEYHAKLGLKPPSSNVMKIGKAVRERLQKGLGITRLMLDLNRSLETRDYLKAIDGRKVPVRSKHSALNTLLQSAAGITFKYATVLLRQELSTQALVVGVDWSPAVHAHDEVQLLAREGIAEDVGRTAVESIRRAGKHLGLRCPLDGEYKVGGNWTCTH